MCRCLPSIAEVPKEAFAQTGSLESISLEAEEVVALYAYPFGEIPPKREVGFRWKWPIVDEKEGHLDHWQLGEFVDIGRDGLIGIAWRKIIIRW